MAQKYKCPIWQVPDSAKLSPEDASTIKGNANTFYRPTKEKYKDFANSFLERIATLD